MKIADKFGLPVIIFMIQALTLALVPKRGQAEAIAKSIECSLSLGVPTISIIIGEGGSGGAIALASSNKILMFENAIYSVISPEGCASILWRDPKNFRSSNCYETNIQRFAELKIIDEIISEPSGGAHRDRETILLNIKKSLRKNLGELTSMSRQDIVEHRKNKFLDIGRKKRLRDDLLSSGKLFANETNKFFGVNNKLGKKKTYISIIIIAIVLILLILALFK